MELAFQVAQNGIAYSVFKQSMIANNLSNMTTTGYKSRQAHAGTFRIPGAKTLATRRDPEQGALEHTAQQLDMAIVGDGFFILESDTGQLFTRCGHFDKDEDGNIHSPSGHYFETNLNVPDEAIGITVHPTGQVQANFADGTTQYLNQLELARFRNPAGLLEIGDNLFMAGPDSGDPIILDPGDEGAGYIKHQFLENSNVDEATEITQQLINQRQFQASLKTFQIMNELVGKTIDMTR